MCQNRLGKRGNEFVSGKMNVHVNVIIPESSACPSFVDGSARVHFSVLCEML